MARKNITISRKEVVELEEEEVEGRRRRRATTLRKNITISRKKVIEVKKRRVGGQEAAVVEGNYNGDEGRR